MAEALYKNADDLEAACNHYFKECEERDKPATVSGLAHSLGFASRQSIFAYGNKNDDRGYIIKRAKLRILQDAEERMMQGKQNVVGPLFLSKNMGSDSLADRQEIQHDNTITITFGQNAGSLKPQHETMSRVEARQILGLPNESDGNTLDGAGDTDRAIEAEFRAIEE